MSNNSNIIKKGDVLWVPYRRDPLWPALVQNIYPKKVTFLFFPLPDAASIRSNTFSCPPKLTYSLLIDEDLPKNADSKLKNAFSEACNYLTSRGLKRGSEIASRETAISKKENIDESDGFSSTTPAESYETDSISSQNVGERISVEKEKSITKGDTEIEKEKVMKKKRKNVSDDEEKDEKHNSEKKLENERKAGKKKRKIKERDEKKSYSGYYWNDATCSGVNDLSPTKSLTSGWLYPSSCRSNSPTTSVNNMNLTSLAEKDIEQRIGSSAMFRCRTQSMSVASIEKQSKELMIIINENIDSWFNQMWNSNRVKLAKTMSWQGVTQICFKNNQLLSDSEYSNLTNRLVDMIRSKDETFSFLSSLYITSNVLLPHIMVSSLSKHKSIPMEQALCVYNKLPKRVKTSSTPPPSSQSTISKMKGGLLELCQAACNERDTRIKEDGEILTTSSSN